MIKLILFFIPAVFSTVLLEYFRNKKNTLVSFFKKSLVMSLFINILVWVFMFKDKKDLSLNLEELYTIGFCLKYSLYSIIFSLLMSVLGYVFLEKIKLALVIKRKK